MQSTTWSIVFSILMIVSGVLAIVIPSVAGLTVTVMFGWLLIFTGALHLGLAWRGHGAAAIVGEIVISVLYAAIGFYLLARPVAGLASLTFAIAVYLVVKGVLEGVGGVHAAAGSRQRLADVRRHPHDRDRRDDRGGVAGEHRVGDRRPGRRLDDFQRVHAVDDLDRGPRPRRVADTPSRSSTLGAARSRPEPAPVS